MDESTGCYDVSGNRKCFVINAVLEGGNNLQVAKQDMEEIQQTMSSMDFETEIKSGDKDRDILTILKEGKHSVSVYHICFEGIYLYINYAVTFLL